MRRPAEKLSSLQEAQRTVLSAARPVTEVSHVQLGSCAGRRLASDIAASKDAPPFDNSAMDGFAIVRPDDPGPAQFGIIGTASAGGQFGGPVGEGEAVKIMTGAAVPFGADTVVVKEACEEGADAVLVVEMPERGANIRRRGEDIRAGVVALKAGTMIGPVETAALASMGMAIIPVFRRPLAAIIATGNELREPGGDASGDAIFDSNSHTLAAMAVQCGAEPKRLGIVGDDKAALAAAIEEALSCDVIITTGGVSVGEHDYVREAFRKAGCRQVFWGLAVRPGRPVFFGDLDGRPVFGLPGNAVSAMVSFTVLAAPALRAMAGNPEPLPAVSRAVLSGGIKKRREFAMLARARVEKGLEGLVATPTGGQGPHQVFGMAGANALCIIPAGIEFAQAGGTVDVIPFGNGF